MNPNASGRGPGAALAMHRHQMRFHARTEAADLPIYVYHCEENGRTLEVRHPMAYDLSTWGEVCYTAQIPLGETDFLASVRKVLSVPGIAIPTGNAELRNQGFTKLVKRDDGVYENVTRSGNEARYMRRGQSDSLPHLAKKIGD